MLREGHTLFLYVMHMRWLGGGAEIHCLKSSNSDKCRHYRSDQRESQVRGKKRKRKKDSWDASVAGFSAHDNSDKARRRRRRVRGDWT